MASGDNDATIASTQAVRRTIEGSGLGSYYGALSSRANFLEGLADLRKGDVHAATRLLQNALNEREQTLDPGSPQILEAEVGLAESMRQGGDVLQARHIAAAAASVAASHKKLGPQYREPLEQLERELGR